MVNDLICLKRDPNQAHSHSPEEIESDQAASGNTWRPQSETFLISFSPVKLILKQVILLADEYSPAAALSIFIVGMFTLLLSDKREKSTAVPTDNNKNGLQLLCTVLNEKTNKLEPFRVFLYPF